VTRDPLASRVPIATSECPVISGATSGSSAARSVDRSTSMYASTAASEPDHVACSARPRPFCVRCTAVTASSSAASAVAMSNVASVLALSAIVMRKSYGKVALRCACSLRTHGSRSSSSSCTGITTSSTGDPWGAVAPAERIAMVAVMSPPSGAALCLPCGVAVRLL